MLTKVSPLMTAGVTPVYSFGPGFDRIHVIPDLTGLATGAIVDNFWVRITFNDFVIELPFNVQMPILIVESPIPGSEVHTCRVEAFDPTFAGVNMPLCWFVGHTCTKILPNYTYRKVGKAG